MNFRFKKFVNSSLLSIFFGSLIAVVAFQNCGKDFRVNSISNLNQLSSSTPFCTFDGQVLYDGNTVTAYQTQSVVTGQTCASEVRSCSNGNLSGSYNFPSCIVIPPDSCAFNGNEVKNGASVQGYLTDSVPFGQSCTQVMKIATCTNGVLNPSNLFPTCKVQDPSSCNFNGQTVQNGASVVAYQSSIVPQGQQCLFESRTCSNGKLSGSYLYASCTNAPPTPTPTATPTPTPTPSGCYDGNTASYVAVGTKDTFYLQLAVQVGQSCTTVQEQLTCGQNSIWLKQDGTQVINTYTSCSPATTSTCSYRNIALPYPQSENINQLQSGQSVKGYPFNIVQTGMICTQDELACNGGILYLNGTQQTRTSFSLNPTCDVGACYFEGQVIKDQQTTIGYSAPKVGYGLSCSTVQQTLKCNQGKMIVASSGALADTYSASCSPELTSTCQFVNYANNSTVTLQTGESASGYSVANVLEGQTCASYSQNISCNLGILNINNVPHYDNSGLNIHLYSACTVGACSIKGKTVLDNQTINAYPSSIVEFGNTCTLTTLTCKNSKLFTPIGASGDDYVFTCKAALSPDCTFDSIEEQKKVTIKNGNSLTYYSRFATPPPGSTPLPVSSGIDVSTSPTPTPTPPVGDCEDKKRILSCENGLIRINGGEPQQVNKIDLYLTCTP